MSDPALRQLDRALFYFLKLLFITKRRNEIGYFIHFGKVKGNFMDIWPLI